MSGVRLAAAPSAGGTDFDLHRDGFGFANDTTLIYEPDRSGRIVSYRRPELDTNSFRHGCFLMIRATLQFSRFARFEPNLPKVSDAEYVRLLRELFQIPPWFPARPHGIVFPGYPDVFHFTVAKRPLVEQTIGGWLPTYLRIGNWRMGFPFPRNGQALAAKRLAAALDEGKLQAVYLARNLTMNHCVLLYHYKTMPGGDLEFAAYDPNYVAEPCWLRYHAATQSFELQKRFFFNQGTVNVMRVYLSPFQ